MNLSFYSLVINVHFIFQTSDNRKKLLDEMAIHIQNKTAESDETIDKLNKELALLNANMQELNIEKNGLQDIIDKLESKELAYKEKIESLEASTAELEMVVAQNKSKSDQDVVNLKETFNDDLRILKDEHEINIRDLTMQLEIGKQNSNIHFYTENIFASYIWRFIYYKI